MMLLAITCGFLAVVLLSYALLNRPVTATQRRLAVLGAGQRLERAAAAAAEDERTPRGELLMMKLRSALPNRQRERLEKLLYAAGVSMKAENAVVVGVGLAIGLPMLYLLLASTGSSDSVITVMVVFVLAILGLYMPVFWLKRRAKKRRKQILRAMPDMMDLLTTCVEAGLGLDAALARVGDKAAEPLGSEIRATLNAIALGTSRRQALERLAARNDVPELTTFITSLVQTESMGTSLGTALRVQAEAVRTARRQRAEQQAQKAPIKIIIVLATLVFPSMFAVILGPAAIGFIERGGFI